MRTFIGILDGEREVWGVRVPDAPGCFGGGATPEEAIESAREALAILLAEPDYVATLAPVPTPIERLRVDPEIKSALARGEVLVVLTRAEERPDGSMTPLAAE